MDNRIKAALWTLLIILIGPSVIALLTWLPVIVSVLLIAVVPAILIVVCVYRTILSELEYDSLTKK